MTIFKAMAVAIIIALPTCVSATLSSQQQSAKERGIMLFKQYKTAEPELRIAAEAGDAEAQFF